MRFHDQVEVHGHLMDTGVLAKVLDDVLDYGGDYRVDRIDLGRGHDDESHAVITVGAETQRRLTRILMRVQVHGVNKVTAGEARCEPADRDGVFPTDFYSTTNLETVVHLDGQWVPVEHPEMDCGLVVSHGRVRTVPVTDVRAGDQIVCGVGGVKVVLPMTDHSSRVHAEYGSLPTSGQPQAVLVRAIARQIREVKAEGGQVLWVAGQAVIATGATPALVALIEAGYLDVLFSGNALATLDIEAALYGSPLGVGPLRSGRVQRGSEQHIRAINAIRRQGSIRAAVESGVLTEGIMHAMVKANKPFVVIGSVRDDGPLPDVHTDIIAGQRAMRAALRGVGYALMVASAQHSVATGNILPASIPVACVDVNPATVHALTERTSAHAVGVVADAGLFLEQLALELVADYRPARLGPGGTFA
ncbi:TIGR00300 family protein [Candidatus Frankia nodulisporulans]|uniref:ornithine cyclodeaminase family domain n=1 Tax=Candidatus Frankia nodulisporulans TaxID=2060052 RepID=UPI0013D36B45|nr:TIGR00300 family protein [Candidatus Frankia nodulisporulans]